MMQPSIMRGILTGQKPLPYLPIDEDGTCGCENCKGTK
jgi:hypothetical protein